MKRAWFFNPVAAREVRLFVRAGRRTLGLALPLVAGLLALHLLSWDFRSVVKSDAWLTAIHLLCLFAQGLGAALGALVMVREREAGTLGELLASPLSPAAIVGGKLIAALALPVMILAGALLGQVLGEVFAAGRTATASGGILPPPSVLGWVAIVVTTIAWAALGVMCGAVMRSRSAALIATLLPLPALRFLVEMGLSVAAFYAFNPQQPVSGYPYFAGVHALFVSTHLPLFFNEWVRAGSVIPGAPLLWAAAMLGIAAASFAIAVRRLSRLATA